MSSKDFNFILDNIISYNMSKNNIVDLFVEYYDDSESNDEGLISSSAIYCFLDNERIVPLNDIIISHIYDIYNICWDNTENKWLYKEGDKNCL